MAFDEPSKHRKKAEIYRWHSYAGKREGAMTSATPPKVERKRRNQSKSGDHGIGDHSKHRGKTRNCNSEQGFVESVGKQQRPNTRAVVVGRRRRTPKRRLSQVNV